MTCISWTTRSSRGVVCGLLGALFTLAALLTPARALAISVPFAFAPGPFTGSLEANVAVPKQHSLDDPRGYLLDISGLLSTTVSYPCGPVACPPGGSFTVYADVSLPAPPLGPMGPVRVFGYGYVPSSVSPQLYPFDARFYLTPEQASYFEGAGTAQVFVTALLGRTSDSFYTRDIYYDQSITDARLEITAAPLPATAWLVMTGVIGLLAVARRKAE